MWWKILLGIIAALAIAIAVALSQASFTPGIILHSIFGSGGETPSRNTIQSRLTVPDGFSVGLYAGNIENARFIEFSRTGDLIVAQPREGKITLIERDRDENGQGDNARTLLENLNRPHSIDFFGNYLYIAESTAVGRVPFDHVTGELMGAYERIITDLGDEGNHWTKTLRFGPDGQLYLSSGSTCNVCEETDSQRATITRYEPDGSGEERFATGLRNAVGFDWGPDGALYATDNGRDLLGDDYPVCELNKIEQGGFYGWPYINGYGDPDPDLGQAGPAEGVRAIDPVHGFRAHNAPLGIRFVASDAFPETHQDVALVALHGSWNRSTYDGYKVVSLHAQEDGGFEERDFLAGFELDGDVMGRPVDLANGPDGCVYVSDDYAMAIYRVCYGVDQSPAQLTAASLPADSGLADFDPQALATMAARGEELFRTRGCRGCHVINVDKAPFGMRHLQDLSDKYTVESMASFFKTPTPPMPPVRLGSPEDELALTVYLLTAD